MYVYSAVVKRIVDGDTFDLEVDLGFNIKNCQRFRLIGIDTAETWRPKTKEEKQHGEFATARVRQLMPEGSTVVIKSEKDAGIYNRYSAVVRLVDGRDLAKVLVEEGFSKREEYGTVAPA